MLSFRKCLFEKKLQALAIKIAEQEVSSFQAEVEKAQAKVVRETHENERIQSYIYGFERGFIIPGANIKIDVKGNNNDG